VEVDIGGAVDTEVTRGAVDTGAVWEREEVVAECWRSAEDF